MCGAGLQWQRALSLLLQNLEAWTLSVRSYVFPSRLAHQVKRLEAYLKYFPAVDGLWIIRTRLRVCPLYSLDISTEPGDAATELVLQTRGGRYHLIQCRDQWMRPRCLVFVLFLRNVYPTNKEKRHLMRSTHALLNHSNINGIITTSKKIVMKQP